MKFIDSYELREWVKDNLRKTIFQKAHALAVQTGCEILVKMHDNHDINGCQYYATNTLKHMYRSSKLQQPGESLVSGETGQPLTDKCIQYGEDASASTESSIPDEIPGSGGGGGGGDIESALSGNGMGTIPMQLSTSEFSNFNSQTQTSQDDANDDSDIEITQITNPQNLLAQSVQVKQEPYEQQQQQQNPMYGQSQQMGDQSMMGNQGMMGNQQPVLGNYQQPIHVTPKPYQCSICRKAFKSVHVLQKHTLTFHTPGGASSMRRGRGRGMRGSRGRGGGGRSLKMTISRTQLQQYQAVPAIKTESGATSGQDPNSTTFEQSDQLQPTIPQSPNQFADPNSSGSMDASGLPTEFPPSASQDDPATSQIDTSWQQQFMPPDGSSPSGLNLPSASSFFGQQNTPTSMYSTPTHSPRASGSGGSGSRSKSQNLEEFGLTKRSIMSGIMQTTGPVAITNSLRQNRNIFRTQHLSAAQFSDAAAELQDLGLGDFVKIQGCAIFVKKPPDSVEDVLMEHRDLCTVETYRTRYNMLASKSISFALRSRLVAMKIVDKKHFM